jgi:signal transduction histidine kinase
MVERLPEFRDVHINVEIEENIPPIKSDPHQLQQVLLNLIINACDAMKRKGMITINTEYFRNSSQVIISVEDTGPGIPENLVDKLFEPFFSTKGTNGLGLAVSWGIVERHGGTIEVDMAETGGAIFRVVLPAQH